MRDPAHVVTLGEGLTPLLSARMEAARALAWNAVSSSSKKRG